ncbi:Stabilin-1 [Liparis tanakae]|uniref:Stabilin-1 n=1 Tax=Liparis tanakae TaxID=230148 RepID=A0A4Z2H4R2_9TELE|nr:Stabilin-1 [Liparis tanakae]
MGRREHEEGARGGRSGRGRRRKRRKRRKRRRRRMMALQPQPPRTMEAHIVRNSKVEGGGEKEEGEEEEDGGRRKKEGGRGARGGGGKEEEGGAGKRRGGIGRGGGRGGRKKEEEEEVEGGGRKRRRRRMALILFLLGIAQPHKYSAYRTMHGSTIKYTCDKTLVGAVWLNENAARVVERFLDFKEGVAYGIDQLLEPPGMGAVCDSMQNKTTSSRCGRCNAPPTCHFRHRDTGKTEPCFNRSPSLGRRHSQWYPLDNPFSIMGCKRVCQFSSWVKQCCKNHYGRDCQVCPGGLEASCSNHGKCEDGMQGSGRCRCFKGFVGKACERCAASYYGTNCTGCSCGREGRCDAGMEGSGKCSCNPGWQGDECQINIALIPEACRRCHAQADCVTGSGCQCKSGFQGNGTFCDPEPPADLCSEYNGGCHLNADCNQTALLVNCTCRSGYQGDGYSCESINRCIEEENGGCSDFASCKFTGPNERQCECLPGFLGNGVQCLEKVVPPVDRCLEDNGGCDPAATCKDLHYHANTAGVFNLRSPDGKYKMNFSQADAACRAEGATLVSFKQLGDAQQVNHLHVSCTCSPGYIGNGDFCNGVLTSVLATSSNFSIFYKFLLDYSGRSPEGRQLVDFMSHRKSELTLFVPHDAGFGPNQTGIQSEYQQDGT